MQIPELDLFGDPFQCGNHKLYNYTDINAERSTPTFESRILFYKQKYQFKAELFLVSTSIATRI